MRVVLDCRSVFEGMGGIGRATAALARHLPAALGPADELVLLRGARGPEGPIAQGPRVREERVEAAMLDAVFEQVQLPGLLAELEADLFHGTSFAVPIAASRVARVATVHDVVFMQRPELVDPELREYLDRWARVSCALADGVVTVSEHARRDIAAVYGRPAERTVVVRNAVDEVFHRFERRAPPGRPYLLYVGALERKKNIPRLLDAFAALVRAASELPHELLLVGGRGGQAFDLEAELARIGPARERVRALGHVTDRDLLELYAAADLFLYLSEHEGFGLPPLEAMAVGVPTIVSDRSALPEVVGDGARLVDPEDPPAVARAIQELLAPGSEREALVARGRARARAWSWSDAARALVAHYRACKAAREASCSGAQREARRRARDVVTVRLPEGHFGDHLALVSAARALARGRSELEVRVAGRPRLNDGLLEAVASAYGDDVVSAAAESAGRVVDCLPLERCRTKSASPDRNYAGCFLAELGAAVLGRPEALRGEAPRLELPALDPPQGLLSFAYVAVQPYAWTAANPPREILQGLVDACRAACPGFPLVAVGRADTPHDLEGLDYSRLGGALDLLRLVRHAALVLTPRSASAHAAAGYGVPAFVWTPEDGEDWHLDYSDWPHARVGLSLGRAALEGALASFARDVARGAVARPGPLRRALERSGLAPPPSLWLGRGGSAPAGALALAGAPSPAAAVRVALARVGGAEPAPYPDYLNRGNAVEYVAEDATALCRGRGIDVGAGPWPLAGATPVRDEPGRNAHELDAFPDGSLDYVFSSHCVEHLAEPERALARWARALRPGGVLLLYLPHPSMELWRVGSPWVPEHRWVPEPEGVGRLVAAAGLELRILTEVPDAYWSFRCVATRSP